MEEGGPYNAPAPRCQLAIIYYFGVAFVSTEKRMAKGGENGKGVKTNKKERNNFGRAGGYYQYACVRFPVAVATPTWTHTFIYIHISTHTHTHRYMCREHPTQYLNIHAYHKLNRKWGNGAQIRDGSSLFSQDFGLYLFVICRSTHHSVRVSLRVRPCDVLSTPKQPTHVRLGPTFSYPPNPFSRRSAKVYLETWQGGCVVAILCRIPWTLSPNRKSLCV